MVKHFLVKELIGGLVLMGFLYMLMWAVYLFVPESWI